MTSHKFPSAVTCQLETVWFIQKLCVWNKMDGLDLNDKREQIKQNQQPSPPKNPLILYS